MNGDELMRSVVAAFAQSDLRPLLNALHDDIVWKSASNDDVFSFRGEHRGRASVIAALSNISKDYTFYNMKPKEIVAAGDIVWGLFEVGMTYDPKGKGKAPTPVKLDMAIRWRLKDGKIIENNTFFDTAHLLSQQKPMQP